MIPNLMELRALRRVNLARQALGLPRYGTAPLWMWADARAWSRHMANNQLLEHTPGGIKLPENWEAWGQNVGEGLNVAGIHDAFMGSQHHRDNILDKTFKRVAIGVVIDAHGIRWETQNFLRP